MSFYNNQLFSFESVNEFTSQNLTIDGTKGGLLLGPSHKDGGITLLLKYKDGYRTVAELEGLEYVLNPIATIKNLSELKKINEYDFDNKILSLSVPQDLALTKLDCFTQNKKFKSKFLLADARGGQFVINKYSTHLNLQQLEYLNFDTGLELYGELVDYYYDENLNLKTIDSKNILFLFIQKIRRIFK